MARHDQRPDKRDMTCGSCKAGNCGECVDILRMVYTDETICTCTRENHDGEPRRTQILDPETGTVHAPGLTISEDGTVTRREPN